MNNNLLDRVFKTAWFAKAAKKAHLRDEELYDAIQQIKEGKGVDLGGGVFKKRLNENKHRSIILAKGGSYWIYEYLFAKKDRDNIDADELADFRTLAKIYAGLSVEQLNRLIDEKSLVEISHEK